MKTSEQPKHDTDADKELLSHEGTPDGKGNYLDIQETLYHSVESGFYLQRRIRQVHRGGIWKTADLGGNEPLNRSRPTRFLKVYRDMTRDEVIRHIVDLYMPEEEGIRDSVNEILDQAGVEKR